MMVHTRKPGTMPFFDKAASAGSLTSRIDHQDAVGVLIALELLAGESIAGVSCSDIDGAVIHCEGVDDLEVVDRTARCLISVKNRPLAPPAIAAEFARLGERQYDDRSRVSSMAVALIGGQPDQTVSLVDKFGKLRSLLADRTGAEAAAVLSDFLQANEEFRSIPVDSCYLLAHYNILHTREFDAIMAHLLRHVAPFTDYTDHRVAQAAAGLVSRFARARHARGSVTLREIRDSLNVAALPIELHLDPTSYVRTAYGYVRHPMIEEALAVERRDVRAAARYAMKRYRRAWKIFPFAPLIKWPSPVGCIVCDHPLIANLGGYTSRGLACPDCGFSPFATLFYACSCGRPIPLVRQPSMDGAEVLSEIKSGMNTPCEHCGQRPKHERILVRAFGLGIPWPPEDFSDEKLIQDRQALGWYSRFSDSKSALDALLSDALRDSLSNRLPVEQAPDEPPELSDDHEAKRPLRGLGRRRPR